VDPSPGPDFDYWLCFQGRGKRPGKHANEKETLGIRIPPIDPYQIEDLQPARSGQRDILHLTDALMKHFDQVSGREGNTLPPAMRMKPLGIIGGTSWRSTAEYYRYINQSVNDLYGNNTNPPLLIFNVDQRHVNDLQDAGEWQVISDIYTDAALKLRAAGATTVLFAANTPYKLYPSISRRAGLPILHIADASGMAIRKKHLTRVGLIGTTFTMQDPFIRSWLMKYYRVDVLMPETLSVRDELQRVIHEELGMGLFKPQTKQFILAQIAELQRRGAQGIVLGCTEFPLVIEQSDLEIPAFDTTRLHAHMAVDYIMGKYKPRAPEQS
jgi:aspartate racemase